MVIQISVFQIIRILFFFALNNYLVDIFLNVDVGTIYSNFERVVFQLLNVYSKGSGP